MVICSLCQVVESRVRVDVRVESVSVHLHYILLPVHSVTVQYILSTRVCTCYNSSTSKF